MIDTIFIISWFGNENVRDRRIEFHNKQLDWCLNQKLNVVILPQKYNLGEYRTDSKITYLKEPPELLGPGQARNILFGEYWFSKLDYAIFADNDCIIDPNEGDGENFIPHFNTNFKEYNDIDLIIPMDPHKCLKGGINCSDYNNRLKKFKDLYDYNHVFNKTMQLKGSLFCLRNIKKAYGFEYYHPKVYDEKQENTLILGGEDNDLGAWFWYHKLGVYHCHNILILEWASKCSTWTAKSKNRKILEEKQFTILQERFGLSRISKTKPYKEVKISDAKRNFIMDNSKQKPGKIVIPIVANDSDMFYFSK